MKYKLLTNEWTEDFNNTTNHILLNRGIHPHDLKHYMNTSDNDIESFVGLGADNLKDAAAILIKTIKDDSSAIVLVDSDADGMTSAAILMNYLYDLFPTWVVNKLEYYVHEEKSHGLSDCCDFFIENGYNLILIPDASSNDYSYHEELYNAGASVIVLDHHEAPHLSSFAITINNQLSDYKNKMLSGAGVTWQFCRYIDSLMNTNYADEYIDLVALGVHADMMSMKSIETKHLINKGFEPEVIKNPYIFGMWEKNKFKLKDHITPMGAAFYIIPMINAICRSGTLEERRLVFESMLKFKAFEYIPSTKRGHKLGEMEQLVTQALRVSTNVKNRQTKAVDAAMEFMEKTIENEDMMGSHRALVFLCGSQVEPGVRGLVANKIMSKYQRCVLVLSESEDSYAGSGRGYSAGGITNFKDICEAGPGVEYSMGHQSAFGCCVKKDGLDDFIAYLDEQLADAPTEPVYAVDYIFQSNDPAAGRRILDIAELEHLWGTDLPEPYVCIKDVPVKSDNFKVMKSNTLKIELPYFDIIKFGGTDDEIDTFTVPQGVKYMDIICRCRKNEWNGMVDPQLELVDYQEVKRLAWEF